MNHYNKLTYNRKAFADQLYNLVFNQLEDQKKISGEESEIVEQLENDPEYIQRIFIDSPWGMGKTYFGKSFEELIESKNLQLSDDIKITSIKINAWEMDYYSDPMKSLMAEILNVLSDEEQEKILNYFEKITEIGTKKLVIGIAKTLASLAMGKEKCEELVKFCNSITSELKETEDFLKDYKEYKENILTFKRELSKAKGYKIILIDELDRCRPTYAIELLEAVKHIFGVKNIIFIFLVNKEQLKYTVSTMYTPEDKCTEYFEKFFDIQFSLPNIEYNDFINIEYNKYNQESTYNINDGISLEREILFEKLYLDILLGNSNNYKLSVRNVLKSFKKYKLLLKSLTDDEKASFPLIVCLAIYFINQEFHLTTEELSSSLFFKTFFTSDYEEYQNRMPKDFNEAIEKYKLKKDYKNYHYYNSLYWILFFKNGENDLSTKTRNFVIYFESIFDSTLEIRIGQTNIKFDKLYLNLSPNSSYRGIYLTFKYDIFKEVEKYKIFDTNYYRINLISDWCKDKYSFIQNI